VNIGASCKIATWKRRKRSKQRLRTAAIINALALNKPARRLRSASARRRIALRNSLFLARLAAAAAAAHLGAAAAARRRQQHVIKALIGGSNASHRRHLRRRKRLSAAQASRHGASRHSGVAQYRLENNIG